jgi:hypothetical protein
MNRQEIFKAFKATGTLRDANEWYSRAHDLLVMLQQNWVQSDAPEPVKKVLEMHMKRMKRYFFALLRMSADLGEGKGWLHLVDGSYAVQKCLYEVYVEYGLTLVYWDLFGSGKNHVGDDLYDRLKKYAAFAKRKGNFERLHRQEEWKRLLQDVSSIVKVPEAIAELGNAGPSAERRELEREAELWNGKGAKIGHVSHWFPLEKSETEKFRMPGERERGRRFQGSMEWRCKAVLGQHFPDKELRQWWVSSYDQDYDFLNAHTHPALGYEENFLEDDERLFEMARLQWGVRVGFHNVVIPPLRVYFRDVWDRLARAEDQLAELNRRISKTVLNFDLAAQGLHTPS